MSNLGNVEILKRRALSGKPGSIEALKQLCSMAEAANSRLFVDVFPVFQKFLSHNKPPVTGTPSTDIPLEALSILWCVGIGVEPMGSRSFNRNNDQILAAAVRKQWQDIINWSSFLFKNYVEPDLDSYEDLSDLSLEVLQKLLFLFGTIFSHPIIGPTELQSTPGAADLIVRIAMYALVVRVPAPESIPNGHRLRASEYSSRIFDELLGVPHWESFWGKEYVQSLNDFVTPRFCAIIAKVLVYLCQEKNLNYNLISNWLRVVSCAASRCMVLTHQLMFHRAVYFTTHILRRVSKVISRNPEAAKDLDVLKTWRWAMDYLSSSFAHGGYDCITLAVNSGLLSALWVLSQAAADTPGWQDYFTADELYVRIMGRLTSASLYRSVQKCLERHIDKLPLCDLHLDAPPGSPLELWVTLKQLLRSRHLLRIKVEFTQLGGVVTFCSNDKCPRPIFPPIGGTFKVLRCAGCRITFYCSRSCQKQHWNRGHRAECRRHVKEYQDGLPRIAEERDHKICLAIIEEELWRMRDEFRGNMAYHYETTRATYIPVLFIDLTSLPPNYRKSIYNLDEAKGQAPDLQWDAMVRDLHCQQADGKDVGPIVGVMYPHPRDQVKYYALILARPFIDMIDD